jgi:hypothetical protein
MNRKIGKNYLFFMLLILIFVLSACTQSPEFELYEGKELNIAVIGELPEVEEEQVRFNKISFDELANEELGTYDAIFITEENLPKAAKSQYADVYLNSTIPFFFIGTDNFVPFTEKDLEYDKTSNWDGSYAVGVLTSQEDESLKNWGFGLYNDKKTDEHIKDVYSRIFMTIEELNR